MDKEKEFEEIEKKIAEICPALFEDGCEEIVCARCLADKLQKAGYGNIEQAVREFAADIIELLDEMGMERSSEYNDGYDDGVADCITNIKSRIKERFGKEV